MRKLPIVMAAAAALFATVPASAQDQFLIDWDEVGEEAINHLIELVRIDSSNPPYVYINITLRNQ